MLRRLHAIPGLVAGVLLVVVALSGAMLSVFPPLERAGVAASDLSVATLASRVSARLPAVETIMRRPSGLIVAYHLDGDEPRASVVDPATGEALAPWQPSAAQRWLRHLHRSLLLSGDGGRVAVGIAAVLLVLIVLSGLPLLARRMGGWRRLLGPVRGDTAQRLHNQIARAVLVGLLLSAATGTVMSLTTFGLLPEADGAEAYFEVSPRGAPSLPLQQMAALRGVKVSQLRQLKFAQAGDPADVIELDTVEGIGMVDPATGVWLMWQPMERWQQLPAMVQMLHTGEGLWWLGLLLGVTSLSVPQLAVTGVVLWWQRRRRQPRIPDNAVWRQADTLLLVGSEGNTTWGFAIALHTALVNAGRRVHTMPMNDIATLPPEIRQVLVLTATYGDGAAPESANRFLHRLAHLPTPPGLAFAVLGFGDRQFTQFCGYAGQVHAALVAHGLRALGALGTVDRQSEPEFRQWCEWLGRALDLKLDVRYQPRLPDTTKLALVSRTDYGADRHRRTAILRLVASPPTKPRLRGWLWRLCQGARLPHFETGDLLGVVTPDAAPRYYSLVSASSDGIVEICVRRQPGGRCSTWLTDLQPGDTIDAFVKSHESFRLSRGVAPVILIGAGTGIGPLVGFIRHNASRRPMHLYFGARSEDDGFLYADELKQRIHEGRLRTLTTAFSRATPRAYVQDRLLAEAPGLRELVAQGADIRVCGGRMMAEGVANAWDTILAAAALSVAQLRLQGRYVEDVYA